jgi:hypothetical protein
MTESLSAEAGAATQDVLLQQTLDTDRDVLQAVSSSPATQGWLKPRLATSKGTDQVYQLLQQYVCRPAFLAKLVSARSAACSAGPTAGGEVLNASWWEQTPVPCKLSGEDSSYQAVECGAKTVEAEALAELEPEPLDSYVIVEKHDVVEAIGTFIAHYMTTLPEAQHLQPRELQAALSATLQSLRKGRVRQLWAWGRFLYRGVAIGYSVFSMYENPWLVRAVLAAIWTASKMMVGMIL